MFSGLTGQASTTKRRLPELRGRTAVSLAECGAEVAVTGEAEVKAQGCQIVVPCQKIQRTRQPQPQLVAIQRYAFDLLEDLSEIDGRAAYFSSNPGQGPASRGVAHEHELDPIHQTLMSSAGARCVGGAWAQRSPYQGQGEALC